MRRIAGIALCIVGLIVALVGIAFSVFGNSDSQATAVAKGGSAPYIYTAPGVLDAVDSKVVVKVSGSKNADITVAYGASGDVASWAEGLKATRITGLKDWKTLNTVDVDGDAEQTPSLAGSDMWIETRTGKGTIDVDKPYEVNKEGSIALIATSSDGKAPDITLTWQRGSNAPNMFPVILIGVLMAIVGAALIVLNMQENRQRAERLAIRERKEARRAARASAETTVLSAQDTDLTGSSRNVQTVATGSALGAGILMSSPNSDELRERSLSDQDRLVLPDEERGEGGEDYGYGDEARGAGYDSHDDDPGARTQIFPVDDYSTEPSDYDGAAGYGQASEDGRASGYGQDADYRGASGYAEYGSGDWHGPDYAASQDYAQGAGYGEYAYDAEYGAGTGYDPSAGQYGGAWGYDPGNAEHAGASHYPGTPDYGASDPLGREPGSSSSDILTGSSLPGGGDGGSPIYDVSESLGHYPNEAAAWEAAFGPNSPGGPAAGVASDQGQDGETSKDEATDSAGATESYLGPNNAWRTRWSFVHGQDSYSPQDYQATEEN
ncbi:MAG: hypothetical protein Q3979_02005 [Actinomycetaceae bacterium]|nr:hypothetical protein [Actinomycetaceae bacterium]